MPRQQRSIQTSCEGRISLAMASYPYDVPKSTLQRRLHGIQARSETASVNRKLSPIEEQSLV
ncbi:hypothetical protein COCVIDRAFT_53718, partial [Bipolaris victoriae FI3]